MSLAEFPFLTPSRAETLFGHQREYLEQHAFKEYWGLLWQTGACKTLPIIANAAMLYLRNEISLVIIFAPNTVHANWIRREIPATLDLKFPLLTYTWDNADTKKAELARQAFIHKQGVLKFAAVNIEALSAHGSAIRKNRAVLFLADLIKAHEGRVMGVVDEADTIGDRTSTRTKRILRFAPLFKYRRIATGTPITEGAFQIYSQSEFLKTGALGYDGFDAFSINHGVFKLKKFGEGKAFNMLVDYKGLDILRDKLASFCSFKRKVDCLDLPPKLYDVREVTLTVEQRKAYDEMRILQLHSFEDADGSTQIATANSAMRKLALLHDITLGYTRVIDASYTPPPGKPPRYRVVRLPTNRLKVLLETLHTLEGKVLIFSECLPALKDVIAMLEKEFGKESVAPCYGAIPDEDRQAGVDAFQDPTSPVRFFAANQATGGAGLTLTAAQTVIFYANGYRLRMRLQAEDRAHRGGLQHPVTYIDMLAPDTVDEKIFKAYEKKIDVASQIVPLFDFFMGREVGAEAIEAAAKESENLDLFNIAPDTQPVDIADTTLQTAEFLLNDPRSNFHSP